MKEDCLYKDDNLHGENKDWHPNGHLQEHSFFIAGDYHGEFKSWYSNGQLQEHCFYKTDELHGEYKSWYDTGILKRHDFDHADNNDITEEVRSLVVDINDITEEEKMLIKLMWGVPCLPVECAKSSNPEHDANT